MGKIPPPKRCGLYLPGHEVHWIQGIHSGDPGEIPPVRCHILGVRPSGTLLIEIEGRRLKLWTHDPGYLEAIVREHGPEGLYQRRWRLLRFPHVTVELGIPSHYLIDVTPASNPKRSACPDEPPRYATPCQQLAEAGGITIRGSDLFEAIRAPRGQRRRLSPPASHRGLDGGRSMTNGTSDNHPRTSSPDS